MSSRPLPLPPPLVALLVLAGTSGCLSESSPVIPANQADPAAPGVTRTPFLCAAPPSVALPPNTSACQVIDRIGGSLSLGALGIRIPENALTDAIELCVSSRTMRNTAGIEPYSMAYDITPRGLKFERPMEVSLAFTGDERLATLFATRSDNEALAAVAADAASCHVTANLNTTAAIVAGTACGDEDCCRPGTDTADVLFVVDNSLSMTEEQIAVTEELPYVARALATGDIDGDGTQDLPAFRSLRIGVASTDQGVGDFQEWSCRYPKPEPGATLRTTADESVGCAASYPAIQTFAEGDDPDTFAHGVGCVTRIGTHGCGFEQPLEAMAEALAVAPEGFEWPHEDSVVGVVTVTDEDDCSASDPEVYNTASIELVEASPNLRCIRFPDALVPVTNYASDLLRHVSHPSRLLVANLVGIPTALERTKPLDLLRDSSLTPAIDPARQDQIMPSCNVPDVGLAFPPTRLVQLSAEVEAQGATVTNLSLCTPDLRPAAEQIVRALLTRATGSCGGG